MCTAVWISAPQHLFGRTLDYEAAFGQEVVVTPRAFALPFRKIGTKAKHYALVGMACVADSYPLYFDGMNEKGVCMAGLNFPDNAVYFPCKSGADNIAPFELIPWILSQCDSVQAAREKLGRLNLCDIPFHEKLPLSPLHWLLADRAQAVVLEQTAHGLQVHDNPVGVLTNNPPFLSQMLHLQNYAALSSTQPDGDFGARFGFRAYSRGMGALGLPGDFSSASRFVRAAFMRAYCDCTGTPEQAMIRFFRLMHTVEVPRGCVRLADGRAVYTHYTCCCDGARGVYAYTTDTDYKIRTVDMQRCDLDGVRLIRFGKNGSTLCEESM